MLSLGIDIGGTFTDAVCAGPECTLTLKVPSTREDPSQGVEAVLAALAERGIDPGRITRFAHGTTVATNAVIQRQGARLGLITTEGFGDTLEIGRQMRHRLYDLRLEPETPGFLAPGARRVEVAERIAADGSVVTPLDEESLARAIARLDEAEGVEAVAVCLLFSFVNPVHERRVAEALAAAMPGVPVSLSSEVDPVFREYERTVATAFDGYIKPVVDAYLARMERVLAEAAIPAPLQVMQSRGGLAAAEVARRRPVRLFLSGPAAGVIGAVAEGRRAGLDNLITIDIGGTSSDIALVREGGVEVRQEVEIDGYRVRVPMLDLVTLGAGGGSVAWLDAAGGLRVGPRSAGAEPGPACYGRGGEEPTVTDASLVLGYVDPAYFAGGSLALEPALARDSVERIAAPMGLSAEAAAAGIHRIANARMVDGIRLVSLNRGHDPRDFALVALGGAGGLHAAALAAELGIRRILVPPAPGVLSAAGLLAATVEHEVSGPYHRALAEARAEEISELYQGLHAEAEALMARESVATLATERLCFADLAYVGQSHYLEVPFEPGAADALDSAYRAFEATHERINGHAMGAPAKIVSLRVVHRAALPDPLTPVAPAEGASRKGARAVWFGREAAVEAAVHDRARIAPEQAIAGPAVIEQADSTTLVPPGWRATALAHGALVLARDGGEA